MKMADAQRGELSTMNYNDIKRAAEKCPSDKVAKEKRPESKLGLGGVPPTLVLREPPFIGS